MREGGGPCGCGFMYGCVATFSQYNMRVCCLVCMCVCQVSIDGWVFVCVCGCGVCMGVKETIHYARQHLVFNSNEKV